MRQAGILPDEQAARRFADYLLTQGIECEASEAGAGGFAIWVYDHGNLERARQELDLFLLAPDDARYAGSEPVAAELRDREEREAEAARRRFVDVRGRWGQIDRGARHITFALIAVSMVVAAASELGKAVGPVLQLLGLSLPRVLQGELWRLVTPIFVHMGALHLLFNMMWLWDLGGIVESRKGPAAFAALVLAIAVGSNLGQALWSGPGFGGMSGVVYGLLGYVWAKSRYDPGEGMALHHQTVVWMTIWFVLCLTGALGPVANVAHAAGLGIGVAAGAAGSLLRRSR